MDEGNTSVTDQSVMPGNQSINHFISVITFTPFSGRRYYYIFQQPIVTSPADLEDRAACDQIYGTVKGGVEEGLAFLQRQRERDPYRDLPQRLLYEAFNGKQAPTFPIDAGM